MELATVSEAVGLTNNSKAISPYTLRQVLQSYSTTEQIKKLIEEAEIDPGNINLTDYAKKTDLPTKLSQLTNDDNYVQTIDGIIPSQYLPSYVDDVLQYANKTEFPNPGDAGKIYIAIDTNLTYRWSGTAYVEISKSLALGTTENSAFRGDHGLLAYQHISEVGNPHGLNLSDLGITLDAETINYLNGLDENILSLLIKKLDISGGTLTGYLTLHHDPVEKMHAATRQYVDTAVDGISVKVTQNITRIEELTDDLDEQKKAIGVQADTITEVKNDITGLNQTTQNHTEAISTMQQDVDSISSTVSRTTETLTILEATVNLLELSLAQYNIVIPKDKNNNPVLSAQYNIPYTVLYQGSPITPDNIRIEGEFEGIQISHTDTNIIVRVNTSDIINVENAGYKIIAEYNKTILYTDTKALLIVMVPRGEDGKDGSNGQDGEPGTPGEDGKTLYTWIKYADTPTSGMSNDPDGKLYMGIAYNKESPVESENYSDYNWSLVKGADGQDGKDGEPGKDGVDGQPGKDGVDGQPGKDGTNGIGIKSIEEQYYASSSTTELKDGVWSTIYPGWSKAQYIWTKTVFTYTDNTVEETEPICVSGESGLDGISGIDGTSITRVDVLYYQSTSSSTLSGGSWDTNAPEWINGLYVWTKNRTYYKDAKGVEWSTDSNPICVTGSKGTDGLDGKDGIDGAPGTDGVDGKSAYQLWLEAGNTGSEEDYLNSLKGEDGKDGQDGAPGKDGVDGAPGKDGTDGKDGVSLSSITNYYSIGDDETTAPTDNWDTTRPSRPEGKVLWAKELITMSDGSTHWSTPYPITGDKGTDGADAAIISDTAPADTSKLWFNTIDNHIYIYKDDKWIITHDYDEVLSDLEEKINDVSGTIDTKIDDYDTALKETIYTKEQVETKIEQSETTITEIFTNKLTTIKESFEGTEETVRDWSGYINAGTEGNEDGTEGVTYLELGNVSSAFKVRIENNSMAILYNGKPVTHWEQDLFEVSTLISRMLSIGNFRHIVNEDGSLSFKKVE